MYRKGEFMANTVLLSSFSDYVAQQQNMYASRLELFNNLFIVLFVIAIVAFVAAGFFKWKEYSAKLNTEKAKAEATKISANADMLEAHIRAADQQNGPLLRALMSNFTKDELLNMLNEVNNDVQHKVTSSNYTESLENDAKLNKQIDDLLSGFMKEDGK